MTCLDIRTSARRESASQRRQQWRVHTPPIRTLFILLIFNILSQVLLHHAAHRIALHIRSTSPHIHFNTAGNSNNNIIPLSTIIHINILSITTSRSININTSSGSLLSLSLCFQSLPRILKIRKMWTLHPYRQLPLLHHPHLLQ